MDKKVKLDAFETLLKNAALEYSNELANDLLPDSELEQAHTFSPEFERAMKKLFDNPRRKRVKISTYIFVAILGVLLLTVTVTAFKNNILNFFLTKSNESTSISRFNSEIDDRLISRYADFLPAYLPDGLELNRIVETKDGFYIKFTNSMNQKVVMLEVEQTLNDISIDTELAEFEEIDLKEKSAFISEKDSKVIIVVFTEQASYTFSGNLNKSNLIKIAESTKMN